MILAIDGSYRDDGITDQSVALIRETLEAAGREVELIQLRDYPLEFCRNCRECMQLPGEAPGQCVHDDGMGPLVQKIEQAEAYVLASPTNFGSVTAVYKRFMERLAVYGYWPWGKPAPAYRKAGSARKPALLVSSCAAPGCLGRFYYSSLRQLKMTARVIGAAPVASVFLGLVASASDSTLTDRQRRQVRAGAQALLR